MIPYGTLAANNVHERFGALIVANATLACPLQLFSLNCLAVQKPGEDLIIHCSNNGTTRRQATIATEIKQVKQLSALADNGYQHGTLLALLGHNVVEIWRLNGNNNSKIQQSLQLMQMEQISLAVHEHHIYLAVLTSLQPAAGVHIYR